NNSITLKSIDAKYNNNTYLALLDNKDFVPENMEVVIEDKKVDFDSAKQMRLSLQNPNLKDTYQIEALAYRDGKEIKGQKFDDDIPTLLSKMKSAKIDNKKWLFTIGIENYNETDDIKYAKRSALAFKKVAKKTLGIKERNSYTLINNKATGTAIKNRLKMLLSEVKKGDTIYFYYNGHGIPDPSKSGEPYMLPSDGIPDFIVSEKAFSLKNIYKQLSDSKADNVVAFVDSCFSGATDGVSIIKGVAGSRLVPKKVNFDKSKMVVLTAGQKKQYSNMYQEKGHRMFSYFVMKSLLSGKKDIDDIYKEISYKVSDKSNELGALKKQEPTINGNRDIKL
ncbi:MAG: caspase family protein, partial [Campylobacterota bacterium]|nr:caspase family protein [Campylobacterota bacterium]